MSIETLTDYLLQYGSIVIFILLFFGIVGIPSPEESLIFLIGVLIAQHQLHPIPTAIAAITGALTGMLTAYAGGRFLGYPLLHKVEKFIGLTKERWKKAEQSFKRRRKRTVVFGFYMPGIRQISPYFAGLTTMPFYQFFGLAVFGTVLWVMPFLVAGYVLGRSFHVNPSYAPLVGVFFLVVMIGWFLLKKKTSKKVENG
ncbi:DedA family protein [Sporosarcina gallistercoris]|uniref:DedA family protein n=1 Tax=Sporosarcina gallistercoris TaxID=2762245 RepID=A0ABR8PMF0_9BACL|nr:DedA family protein [Sporosarcina gallistercoris]MBD7909342.1 DedA family protein [Sporosarcina gallistercoris]